MATFTIPSPIELCVSSGSLSPTKNAVFTHIPVTVTSSRAIATSFVTNSLYQTFTHPGALFNVEPPQKFIKNLSLRPTKGQIFPR